MTTQKTLKLADFFAEQRDQSLLFGLFQPEPGTVRLFLWMEGFDCFHKVFIDLPEKAINQVHPTDKKVLHGGELLTLAEVDFVDGIESYFTINDLFEHLQKDCILLHAQHDSDQKSRRGAQVDAVVARLHEYKGVEGLNSLSRPVV